MFGLYRRLVEIKHRCSAQLTPIAERRINQSCCQRLGWDLEKFFKSKVATLTVKSWVVSYLSGRWKANELCNLNQPPKQALNSNTTHFSETFSMEEREHQCYKVRQGLGTTQTSVFLRDPGRFSRVSPRGSQCVGWIGFQHASVPTS